MKGSKRLLAMLLAVMMVVTALPMGVFAEEEPVVIDVPAEEPAVKPAEEPSEEEPAADEVQVELSGTELDLYWVKYRGIDNGVPNYNTSSAANFMWDEVGQDINAVFLLGDGRNFIEVPFEGLVFPEGLHYSQNDDYANAVYMKFDTALEGNITYTKDGVTYEFPLEVEIVEEEPLKSGLYWCGIDETENGVYIPRTDDLQTKLDLEVGDGEWMAVYFYDGENLNLLKPEQDLTFTFNSAFTMELLDDTEYFFSVEGIACGTGSIVYSEYSLPVMSALPYAGFYSAPQRTEANLVTTGLRYNGKDEDDNGEPCTVYYILGDGEEVFTSVEVMLGDSEANADEVRVKLADDGTSALLYIYEGVGFDSRYKVNLYQNAQRVWGRGFSVRNESGSSGSENGDEEEEQPSFSKGVGVYWLKFKGMKNGEPVYGYANVDTSMWDEVGQDIDAVFVFWDGETATEIAPDQLAFPENLKYEVLDEYQNAVHMEFDTALNVVITYTKDDKTYEFPLEVEAQEPLETGLYWCSFGTADDGSFTANTHKMSSILTNAVGYSNRAAFFFVEDQNITQLYMDDLTFPSFVNARLRDGETDGYFQIEFQARGNGHVTYTKDGVTYELPIKAELPPLGYYSDKTATPENDLEEMLMGFYGETKTAYLVWDPEELGEVERVTVYFKMSNAEAELDGVELEDAESVLAEHDIVLTPCLDKGYIQIDAGVGIDKNLELTLYFAGGYKERAWLNIDNELTVIINEWRSGKENPVVEYEGVEYTFGIGRIENSGKFDMFRAGGGFGATTNNKRDNLEETVYLGAMTDFETNDQAAAPAWVYDYITDVSFEIAGYINTADLTKEESNVYINRVYKTPMAEMEMYTADIRTEKGGFVEALLQVRFTVAFPGQKPVECLVENVVHYAYNLSIIPDLSEVDTADELNELLSGEDAFMDWIRKQDKENGTTMYDDYRGNFALNWEASFELILPAVTYDDIITVSLDNVEFGIEGSAAKDGSRTTMPGMKLLNNNYFFMNGINFVADKRITQSYGNETFTCGILSGDEDADFAHCDAYKIHDCTFTGFDYGVRNTQYGYTCVGSDNVFTDCEVGYLIDCAGKRGGNANDSTEYSRFVNCGTAIRIKGLPDYLTPYDYRIYNCDFIGNDMDIDVSQEGRFYFIENYYGDPKHKNEPVVSADDVHKCPPSVRGRGYADVVVNPRWRDPVTLEGSNHDSNHLIVDTKHGLVNYMFNDDALGWSFDSSTLNTDLSNQAEGINLTMTNDQEETLGTWGIAGGAAQTQLLSLFAAETTVADTFCPALDIDERKDGSIRVTVDDSELFDLRKVTLTIPCDFIQASVELNDTPVAAITSGGKVTFTVVQGGTYVIAEALDEETIEKSFVPGGAAAEEDSNAPEAQVQVGWFDYNADQTEDSQETKPSFVQIGTETQQEVQQVNPDDENLGAAEDTLVETEVVKVQAIYQAPVAADSENSVKITVLLVLYDGNGRMVAMQEQAAEQNEGTKVITVECDKNLISTGAVQVRAFVISANGDMSPLAPVPFSQTLEIPQ